MRIAVLLQDLRGGGAERIAVHLANGFAEAGNEVELLLIRPFGPYLENVSSEIKIVHIRGGRTLCSIVPLAFYLRRRRPDALLAHLTHVNVAAILAGLLAGSRRRVFAVEHNQISRNAKRRLGIGVRIAYWAVSRLYPHAGGLVAVSRGVAEDVTQYTGLAQGLFTIIHNPVVPIDLEKLVTESVAHSWFSDVSVPLVVSAGRLDLQKDFPTLLQAFSALRSRRDARLTILGEGPERPALNALIKQLGIEDSVSLPGFVSNPYAYFARASLFVLSSRWEGLPTVLIEALACGVPVVSTDCPSGPGEILEGGRLGHLVSVGDTAALTEAMLATLDDPGEAAARRARARDFTIQLAVERYARLLEPKAGQRDTIRAA